MNGIMKRAICSCAILLLSGLVINAAEENDDVKKSPKRAVGEQKPAVSSTVRGHALLIGGTEMRHVYRLGADGKVEWSYPTTGPVCDLAQRANGNVLFTDRNSAQEIRPDKTVLWKYEAPKGCEIFTCQPLADGKVMILRNGTPPKIMEFDTTTGEVVKTIVVPTTTKSVHAQFRVGRKTSRGTYLLPYLSEHKVCELNKDGKIIRTIPNITGSFQATLLDSGNVLIGGGRSKQVVEVAPDGNIVWKVDTDDLPGEPLNFVGGVQRLPNGNTLIGNWAGHVAHAPTAQLLEVTPLKKVVWKFNDWKNFSALASFEVLDIDR